MAALRPSILLILVLALLAVEIPARVVQVEDEIYEASDVAAIVEPIFRQARAPQQATATVTVLRTTTLSSVLSTVITTKKTCGILGSAPATVNPGGITTFMAAPASACRRRRQYWNEPIFVGFKHDDDTTIQYFRLSPSQVLSFEPTMLPQFRNTNNPKITELVQDSPAAIEPSFEKDPQNIRIAQPVFGGSLSSIISSIVSGILTTTTTTTSVITSYTSTSASTSFTGTASYYVLGACYPSGLVTC